MTASICKSCGAPIEWVRTDKGKAMPLDVGTVAGGNVRVEGGVAVYVSSPNIGDRVSHFATCPNAQQHRRRETTDTATTEEARIRGLTLWRPWAWAICSAGKRIENRPWRPPASALGNYLAIHAGKSHDKAATQVLRGRGAAVPVDGGPQGIVAVARLVYCFTGNGDQLVDHLGEEEACRQIDNWWDPEQFGWCLADVVAIEPVPCRGMQGLWPLPPDVLELVRARWKGGRDAR